MVRFFERRRRVDCRRRIEGTFRRDHRGLFLQNRSVVAQDGEKVRRSGLAKSYTWAQKPDQRQQRLPRGAGGASRAEGQARRSGKLRITIEWSGRLGNLMFEVAMLPACGRA